MILEGRFSFLYRFILLNKVYFSSLIILLSSCLQSDDTILVKNHGAAQGTYYHIQYLSANGKDYKFQIDSILDEIDSSLSIYQEFSLISKINQGEKIDIDSFFNDVFLSAKQVYLETNGYFDCTVYPIVREWGFYDNVNLDNIDSARIERLLGNIGFNKISLQNNKLILPENMFLDFNALAQGYSVDLIVEFLKRSGCKDFLVEIGGELFAEGRNPDGNDWKVGVDKPMNEIDLNSRFYFILELSGKALATSGNYHNFYEKDGVKYSHIINPFTGFPAKNRLLSVSIIHNNCMLADAYATAFMSMGVKKSKEFLNKNQDIEGYLIYTDNYGNWETYISDNFKERLIN
jgi:thiamine biosynthesis lipoprotein